MDEIRRFTASGDHNLVRLDRGPAPSPAADEAVVAVDAYSVNRGEILLLEGGRTEGFGKDVAGRVVVPAAGGPAEGTRVVAHLDGGGWAERVAVRADRLVEIPGEVSTEAAASLPLPGLTALRLLRIVAAEGASRVLLDGASGGVGHAFCELAAGRGIAVTAVARDAQRGERLLALGAERVVSAVEEVGEGFDAALDSVGGAVTAAMAAALRPGGLLVWFGQASGEPAVFDFFTAAMERDLDIRLRSFAYFHEAEHDREDLTELVELSAAGRLHPEVGSTAPWEQTPEVLAAVRDRQVRGNAVLVVA